MIPGTCHSSLWMSLVFKGYFLEENVSIIIKKPLKVPGIRIEKPEKSLFLKNTLKVSWISCTFLVEGLILNVAIDTEPLVPQISVTHTPHTHTDRWPHGGYVMRGNMQSPGSRNTLRHAPSVNRKRRIHGQKKKQEEEEGWKDGGVAEVWVGVAEANQNRMMGGATGAGILQTNCQQLSEEVKRKNEKRQQTKTKGKCRKQRQIWRERARESGVKVNQNKGRNKK